MKPKKSLVRIEWLASILVLSAFVLGIGGFLLKTFGPKNVWTSLVSDFYANVVTDLIGIGFGILVIDRLSQRRNDEREKRALISQMASPFNVLACDAIRIIRERGWHNELLGISLYRANLENGDLYELDLSKVNLVYANLANANLCQSILNEALLHDTNLTSALLHCTKLRNAEFRSSIPEQYMLKGAELIEVDLTGATFKGMTSGMYVEDEQHIQLQAAKKLAGTIMPNGKRYDGRYYLQGDVTDAEARGHDIKNTSSMAQFYGVTAEEYRDGQQWFSNYDNKLNWWIS